MPAIMRIYDEARDGNVALTGEIDVAACGGEFNLAVGFGANVDEAFHRGRAALFDDFSVGQVPDVLLADSSGHDELNGAKLMLA